MIQQIEFVAAWMQTKFGVDFSRDAEEGQGLVEYALILVLVALVCVGALTLLAGGITNAFSKVTAQLNK